jgi:ribosomal protein L31
MAGTKQGIHDRIMRTAVGVETAVGNALTDGTNLRGHAMTCDVPKRNHDLEAGKICFAKGELRELSDGRRRHALPRG